ncbi:MAG: pantothenate kinase [Clostridia bacterium]|nr:pantothenate kinase [Clostridia bacterium]
MNKTIIGIDVGGTTTKIVGFRNENGKQTMLSPKLVQAADPVTSVYGALGKFTSEHGLGLSDIDQVMMTGVGSTLVGNKIYDLSTTLVPEFSSIGIGGLYLSGLDEAIVVSMGTGTALVHAKKGADGYAVEYLGGTGVGGGTLLGLSKKLAGVDNIKHLEQLYAEGDLSNVDLRIKDISKRGNYSGMNENLTAANFGKLSDLATPADLALGVANLVTETIAMLALFAAKRFDLESVVLVGNLSSIGVVKEAFLNFSKTFGIHFIVPENARFGTGIGAALNERVVE